MLIVLFDSKLGLQFGELEAVGVLFTGTGPPKSPKHSEPQLPKIASTRLAQGPAADADGNLVFRHCGFIPRMNYKEVSDF